MNQFPQQIIRQYKKDQNFPSSIVEKDCLVYKELIFEENPNANGLSSKNLSECFIVESSNNKEEENKATLNRGWKGNENNKKTLSKKNNNNSAATAAASGQTGWKSSKYVNTESQEKENIMTQSQSKNTEEKEKKPKSLNPNKDAKQTNNNPSSNLNNNAEAFGNNATDNNKKDENESDEYDGYFINPNNSKGKSFNSNLEKELDKNVKSIIKNAMEDEESILTQKESEISESAKKAKKKKKKPKNKAGSVRETDSKANITVNSEKTEQNETLGYPNQNKNDTTSFINESDLSMSYQKHPFIGGPNLNFANYAMMNNNSNNPGVINNQFLNDTMMMPNPQNFYKQIPNSNNNNNINNTFIEDSISNNTNNSNNSNTNTTNQSLNQTGIPMFPHNLMHPMQPGLFLNPNAPKVIYPQIDPTKNLNFFIPGTNIFHPNLILEPVEIENIFKLNKRFNIAYEQSLWYLFNPLNASMSLPLSSKQICDMYNMKLINAEVDLRPIDVFQFKSKNLFAFAKLKMLNDPSWTDDIVDSQLLPFTTLNQGVERLKEELKNVRKETENYGSEDKHVEKNYNNNFENGNKYNNNNNKFGDNKEVNGVDDNFEVVGGKKGKNAFGNNQFNNNSNKAKKPIGSQAAVNRNNNYVPASNPVNIINKNDFNTVTTKNNSVKPLTQSNPNTIAKNQPQNSIPKPNPNLISADETLLFSESIIQAKGFENNNNQTNFIADNQEIIDALDKGEASKKQALNNILVDAEEDWEVVDKRKKIKQNKEKEKAIGTTVKVAEIKEEPKPTLKKQEDSIDIVEKLKMNNPYFQSKDAAKPQNSIDSLLNNNKFEVVVKKKKKKDDGKSKPPGMK